MRQFKSDTQKYVCFENFMNQLFDHFYQYENLDFYKMRKFAFNAFKNYHTENELADLFKVHPRTIRNYRRVIKETTV